MLGGSLEDPSRIRARTISTAGVREIIRIKFRINVLIAHGRRVTVPGTAARPPFAWGLVAPPAGPYQAQSRHRRVMFCAVCRLSANDPQGSAFCPSMTTKGFMADVYFCLGLFQCNCFEKRGRAKKGEKQPLWILRNLFLNFGKILV